MCRIRCRSVHGKMGLEWRSHLIITRPRFAKEDAMIADFASTLDGLKDKLRGLRVYL